MMPAVRRTGRGVRPAIGACITEARRRAAACGDEEDEERRERKGAISHVRTVCTARAIFTIQLTESLALRANVRHEQREHRVIEPAAVASLGLARDALEAKAQSTNHVERRVVVGRRGHADAVAVHP